jgi:redox-sensitive bicupin YhaK (pirin superfamily)
MIIIRPAQERGHADHGWLDTWHTFSFDTYHDPAHVRFRSLRVINQDRIAGGRGFGLHPHRDMEIVTYIVSGALEHQDSMGNRMRMGAGDVQRISAGTGIEHSEYNASAVDPVHLLQIWIFPDQKSVTPRYAEKSFGAVEPGALHLIASHTGRADSIPIHQDADVYVARLSAGASLEHPLAAGRYAWLQLIAGTLAVNGTELHPGDGAAISDETSVTLDAREDSHYLLFDLI